jgi:hypothetical protein
MHPFLFRAMENGLGLPRRLTACRTEKEHHDMLDLTAIDADIEELVDAFAAVRYQ